jgi:chemotaxis family two-component system sensor kinase Cph1
MQMSKRVALGLSGLLSLVLSGVVVRDIYVDWLLEGKSLWSTLAENAVPVILAVGIVVAGYVVYENSNEQYMRTLTKWQYLGAAGILLIALEVVGLQLVQGELKPRLIIIQMTIGGAIAGTLVGYANAQSVDARKTAERERDKFEALFENSPAERAEVCLAGDELSIEAVNEPFKKTFGITGASAVGERLFATVDHDSDIESELRQHVATATEYETDLHTATDDGLKDFQLRVVPFGDEQRAYLLYTDVTDLRRAKAELEQTVNQLEQSNDRLQQFAYVASHDLQEPARMVSSYMSLLDSEYGDELDEEAQEYIDFATDGANRMQDMIDGLLDYSRVRTNAQEFTTVDADDVFGRTLDDLGLLIDERDVTVTHDTLPTVEADERQLGQLFQNLVENAIEHGGDEIHVGTETGNGETIFSVADNGEGIPENRQDRIFELFEQGSRDDEGTGIGLAICDRIVSRHGGEMWVESAEGAGTTFYFSIPS